VLADALQRPVRYVQVRSASAAGAAVLAARGVGLDLQPQRAAGPLVEPHGAGPFAAVRERWAAALS
jgi:xylulokinase